jgi:hypothetical protein
LDGSSQQRIGGWLQVSFGFEDGLSAQLRFKGRTVVKRRASVIGQMKVKAPVIRH